MKTEQQIEFLKQALSKFGIPQRDYSLKGYSEDRICLDYNQEQWHVYMAERGHKRDIYQNRDADSAVMNFIDRLADDETETKDIYDYYKSLIKANEKPWTSFVKNKRKIRVRIGDTEYIIRPMENDIINASPIIVQKKSKTACKGSPVYLGRKNKPDYVANKSHQLEIRNKGTKKVH